MDVIFQIISILIHNQPTMAGVVVGVVGALIVVLFVAAILIWKKRTSYRPGVPRSYPNHRKFVN